MLFRLVIALLSWFTLLSCSSPNSANSVQTNKVIGSKTTMMHKTPTQQVRVLMREDKQPENFNNNNTQNNNSTQNPPTFTNSDLAQYRSDANLQNMGITFNYHNQPDFNFETVTHERFKRWLEDDYSGQRKADVNEYYKFLTANTGGYIPPMEQMLRSARSWLKCGFEPYGVPPRHEWGSMIGTIRLIKVLVEGGYLPRYYQLVSVYRNPELNRCARGSSGSKHVINAAVDLRVDYADNIEREQVEDAMCQFWYDHGEQYSFGLGLYKSGSIHIDTQGHRTWGSTYRSTSSRCVKQKYRYIN